jgi:hypothetical protein
MKMVQKFVKSFKNGIKHIQFSNSLLKMILDLSLFGTFSITNY